MALVFDRLSPEARTLACSAAARFVNHIDGDRLAGVFLSDLSLVTVQPYTSDRARLRQAIERVTQRAVSTFNRDESYREAAGGAVVESAEVRGRTDLDAGVSDVLKTTLNTWEALGQAQQGLTTVNALKAVVSGLSVLPGRKSVIFFSEGVAVPDAVLGSFKGVVATANMGNVSIYAVDAAGLRVHSKDNETASELRAMGNAGLTLNADGSSQSNLATLERNEDVLRRDPRTSLTLLVDPTGGFLIADSNNLATGLQAIERDSRSYYLLTYSPRNQEFRGEWRAVTVRVRSRKVQVRSRSGYLAVPGSRAMAVSLEDGPALAALAQPEPPHDLPLRGATFVFPDGERALLAILVQVDGGVLKARSEPTGSTTDFTILARLRDLQGKVVTTASQRYRLPAGADGLQGDILFFRQPEVAAGRYVFEYVVVDAVGGRAGTGARQVEVPPWAPDQPSVSDLVLVHRTETVAPSERDPRNPLYVGALLLYPSLGEPVRKARAQTLSFYLVVRPGVASVPLNATLELVQVDGRPAGRVPMTLPPADSDGRVRVTGQLPLASIPVGTYRLRVSVAQGPTAFVREATVTIIE